MLLKKYFKMLRMKDWIKSIFWIPIIGAFLVSAFTQDLILIAIISFLITSYAFVVNNYFDTEIDKKHKEKVASNKNPLANGLITKEQTLILLIIFFFTPLILAIQMNFKGFILVLLALIISTLYSMSRIRLKERPGLDIISHGLMLGFFPFLAGVALVGGTFTLPLILTAILFMILCANGLLIHQIIDYHEDFGNTKSLALIIGREISLGFFILLILLSLLCFKIILNYFFFEVWLVYFIAIFLIFCFPVSNIKKIKKEFVKIYQSY